MSTPTYPLRGSSQPLPHGLAAPGVLGEGPYPRAKSTGPPDASPAALSFLELSTQPYTLEDYLWCLGLTWSAVVAQAVMDPLEKNIFGKHLDSSVHVLDDEQSG